MYDFGKTTTPPHAEPGVSATGKLYYLLMEYVDGTNLRQVIQQGQLKPEEALAIVPQICEALGLTDFSLPHKGGGGLVR